MGKKPVKFDEALYNQAVARQQRYGGTIEGNLIEVIKEQRKETKETTSYTEETRESDLVEYEPLPPVSRGTTLATRQPPVQVIDTYQPRGYVTREEFEPYQRATAATVRSYARHLHGHAQLDRNAPQTLTHEAQLAAFIEELEITEGDPDLLEDMYSLMDTLNGNAALSEETHG